MKKEQQLRSNSGGNSSLRHRSAISCRVRRLDFLNVLVIW